MLGMRDLVVFHLAQLLKTLPTNITSVRPVVTVNFLMNAQFVKGVGLVSTQVTLKQMK